MDLGIFSTPLGGALIGGGITIFVGVVAWLWRLHSTVVQSKTKLDIHTEACDERTKDMRLNTTTTFTKIDRVSDKIDALVKAQHDTHNLLTETSVKVSSNDKKAEVLFTKVDGLTVATSKLEKAVEGIMARQEKSKDSSK